jgi:DinB superfamily
LDHKNCIRKLEKNADVFKDLLSEIPRDEYLWRYDEAKWCLLEVVCHLYDEEREDFRTRVRYALESSAAQPPRIDPVGWVHDRNYIKQDYQGMLNKFLEERELSVKWLMPIPPSRWDNSFNHPILGDVSAQFFLANWLAHDYLHIRQILRIKYLHLKISSDEDLKYAGEW